MDINREKNLINILVEKRFITKRELSEAIERHKNVGGSIIESLLFLDFLDYKKLGRALSLLFQVPYINLEHIKITPEILEKIPLDFAEKYHLFPAGFIENKKALVVAMEDPSDQNILEKMRRFLEVDELRIGVAYSTEIERAINRYYKGLDLPELKKEIQLPKDFKIIEESDKERTTGWDLKDLVGKKKDRKVLLIEPDHEIRNPILSIMKKEGYVIEAVVDDSSAIELLGKKRFDLVLKRKKSGKGAFLYEKELKKANIEIRYFEEIGHFLAEQPADYDEMIKFYFNTLNMIFRSIFSSQAKMLSWIDNITKYAKLIGSRITLPRHRVDAIITSAYLIILIKLRERIKEEKDELSLLNQLAELANPFNLQDIIYFLDQPPKEGIPIESQILTILMDFEKIKLRLFSNSGFDLEMVKDIMREKVGEKYDEKLLEIFFTILKDELFLDISQEKGKVLFIDSEIEDDSLICLKLKGEGYIVRVVHQGRDAIKAIKDFNPSLILSEVELPDINGIELFKFLINKVNINTPFLFITKNQDPSTAKKGLKIGAEDYITKPFNIDL
ncbi:MAG: hypothetical protein DRG20_05455 [Deltaproteobacteria bacterium]|nr:MAG: hypothetical protein DRG20_05455 [Deltaproteobacteria bacterium]